MPFGYDIPTRALVMEHVDSYELWKVADKLAEHFCPGVAWTVSSSLCTALSALEGCGLPHRDLHWRNVLIYKDEWKVCLIDPSERAYVMFYACYVMLLPPRDSNSIQKSLSSFCCLWCGRAIEKSTREHRAESCAPARLTGWSWWKGRVPASAVHLSSKFRIARLSRRNCRA